MASLLLLDLFLKFLFRINNFKFDKEIEIIDGQQRITSYMLLSVLVLDWIEYEQFRPNYFGSLDETQLKSINRYFVELASIIYQKDSLERNISDKQYPIPDYILKILSKKDAEMTNYLVGKTLKKFL